MEINNKARRPFGMNGTEMCNDVGAMALPYDATAREVGILLNEVVQYRKSFKPMNVFRLDCLGVEEEGSIAGATDGREFPRGIFIIPEALVSHDCLVLIRLQHAVGA